MIKALEKEKKQGTAITDLANTQVEINNLKQEKHSMMEERNALRIQANEYKLKLHELQADNVALKLQLESRIGHTAGNLMDERLNNITTECNALIITVNELEAALKKSELIKANRDSMKLRLEELKNKKKRQ